MSAFTFKAVHGLFLHNHETHAKTHNACLGHESEQHFHETETTDDDCAVCHFVFTPFDNYTPSIFSLFVENKSIQTAFSYFINEKHSVRLPKSLRAPPFSLS
jgi:hypothetical protein